MSFWGLVFRESNVFEIEADEAGNITTADLNFGVITNDTIEDKMAAINDSENKNFRFAHM
jgi:hypothetical protein